MPKRDKEHHWATDPFWDQPSPLFLFLSALVAFLLVIIVYLAGGEW